MRTIIRIATLALLLSLVALPCLAEVSPEEAATLKTTLTPFGAERAGNKEGTIPAWTGKLPPVPAGTKHDEIPGELFPDDKPLFSITSKNMDQYADKLTDGVKAWMKRYPDYRLDVYPTRRTAAFPEFIYEATFKNATRGKVSPDGLKISGAIGGIPFPIPKSGVEIIWNHSIGYHGASGRGSYRAYIVSATGKKLLVTEMYCTSDYPWSYKGMTEERYKKEWESRFGYSWCQFVGPPASVGEMILTSEPSDYSFQERVIYTYLVGQRRVRRAPQFAYDTPNPATSGYTNNDEGSLFYGKNDRYTWKLLGKKEMYIPYNTNRVNHTKDDELVGEHFPNPDKVRWELHRVWVVEATVAPGKRHVAPRRMQYFDEDTWWLVGSDIYDPSGRLWKVGLSYLICDPRIPIVTTAASTWFNLQTNGWVLDTFVSPEMPNGFSYKASEGTHPKGFYSPDSMAARGLR